ncbi:MAG: EamA family transporter [Hydrogenophaga sp.]|jgi:drug/metabolite transporter (DMT)-like permease|uniref:EamA family transporter n=1 Tax=Hydrogenophaga sp. TaxID=1904254 RepID=UPI0026189CA6|nr:EamA family transporter [Hydrogenophaga sp.]MCV0441451.1 EamA family transporter [Hydrogenophaga sp.]
MPSIFNPKALDRQTLRLGCALLIVYLVWGTTYFALDVAMQTLPPLLMNGARFLLAGVLMLGLARWQGQAWPTAAQWRASALIGGLMAFAAMALVVLAQKLGIGSGLMATVVTTMPMWLALWTRWGGERVPLTSWIGLVLGAAGALLLALEGDFSTTLAGTLCAFGAPLAWSLGSYASRRLPLPPPAMASSAQWLLGGLLGLVVAWLWEPGARSVAWQQVSLASALAWLYLVFMGTMVTLNTYLWLLKNTSAALAGSYSFVNPVVALCVGVLLGGEHLTGWVFVALPLIGLALALLLYGSAAVRLGLSLWRRGPGRRTAAMR